MSLFNSISINDLRVFVFSFNLIDEKCYVILRKNKAIIIDPHFSEDLIDFLKSNKIRKVLIFLTHEHPDHTCGVPLLNTNFDCEIFSSSDTANYVSNSANNRPLMFIFLLGQQHSSTKAKIYIDKLLSWFPIYSLKVDHIIIDNSELKIDDLLIKFIHTPGHSKGSYCILVNNSIMFSGDSLLLKTPVITRFPGGASVEYNNSTLPFLRSLSEDVYIFPGHGMSSYKKDFPKAFFNSL